MSVRRMHRLLEAAFRDMPTFRMGYDHHVKAWRKATQREVWIAYYSNPTFAANYDERRREQIASAPVLAWGAQA